MPFEAVALLLMALLVLAALVLLAYMLLSKRTADPYEGVLSLARSGDRVARLYYGLAAATIFLLLLVVAKLILYGIEA